MGHPDAPEPDPADPFGPGAKNTRLLARAIRERWPMPDHVRVKILDRLCKTLDDNAWGADAPEGVRPGHREVISAARALITADRINLDAERLALQAKDPEAADLRAVHDRLDADMGAYHDPDDAPDEPHPDDAGSGTGAGPGVVQAAE